MPDVCRELCTGANRDYGTLPCVDGNLTPLDGCNEKCEVEKGWECTQGWPSSADGCYEVCGDSWDMQQFECEDGNVNYLQLGNNNDGYVIYFNVYSH